MFVQILTNSRFIEKSDTVIIKNILLFDNMLSVKDYDVFEADMLEELSKYGEIQSLVVPRPSYLRTEKLTNEEHREI